MARHVEDLWTLMPILLPPDGEDHTVVSMPYGDPGAVDINRLRIAFFADNGIAAPDAETEAVVRCAAQALGAEERRPPGIERSYDLEMQFLGPDGGDGVREFLRAIGSDRTHPLLDGWLAKLECYRTSAGGFARYWSELDGFRAGLHAFRREYDAILSPVAAHAALPHGASVEEGNFRGFSYTMTWNLAGWPAAVVRCGADVSGMPVAVQVTAAPWRDDIVLAVTRRLEEAFGGWHA
jgi:amidase